MLKIKSLLQIDKLVKWCLKIEKRFRFVISTLILSLTILISTFFLFDKAWLFIPILAVIAYLLTYFSIIEEIEKSELLTLFIVPIFFTISYYLFYFLFPIRWLTRVPFVVIYSFSIYAILLTSNILNVGVEKSLQLYRAAFSVNYFYQSVIVFLFSNILFSFRGSYFTNAIVMGIAVFPLSLQLYWSVKLNLNIERELLLYSLLTAIIISQLAVIVSFVPFKPSISGLIITSSYYSLAGLINAHLDDRLFEQTIKEYSFVLAFVILIAILTLSW